jgi:methionyl-tRNA formyltransferase
MDKLKIGYFADGPWAHNAFEQLNKDESLLIDFIVPRHNTTDDDLKSYSKKNNIDYLKTANVNSSNFLQEVSNYQSDLFISMSFNQIFKGDFLNLPKLGVINCHAGKLPFYRGRNILNWVLINDENDFGVTVHYVDEGIDTGDIVVQETYFITDDDDYNTLLNRAYVGCGEQLYKAVKKIQSGDVNSIKQSDIHPVGFYCGRRTHGDEVIDWNQTSREIFNFVRAICKPGPKARAHINGKEMKINKIAMIEEAVNYRNTVGQIVGRNGHHLVVKTLDTTLEIIEYEFEGKIRIGDRFE